MKRGRAAALLLAILMLSGCTYGMPLEEMLSPPKLSDEQLSINNALVDSKGQGFTLKYPKGGEHLGSFVMKDIDGDLSDEAIVFYEMDGITSERVIWINFMDKDSEGRWHSVYEMSVKGSDIEQICFTRLGDDNIESIIICYSINQSEKAFKLVRFVAGQPQLIFDDAYTYLEVDDFFQLGYQSLLVIKNDRALVSSTANFFTWLYGSFSYYGSVQLDPSAGEYLGLITDKVNSTTDAVIIEHKKAHDNDYYGTDLLYWSGNRLVNAIYDEDESLNVERTSRRVNTFTEYATPMDINGDGYVEVCGTTEFPNYENVPASEKLYMVTWRAFDLGVLNELYSTYFSSENGFVIILPNRWRSSVTAVVSQNNRMVSFYPANADTNDENLLLSIFTSPNIGDKNAAISGAGNLPPGDWQKFRTNESKGYQYYIRLGRGGRSLLLTSDELSDSFRMI